MKAIALAALVAASAFAQEQAIQRELIRRQQQSDAFSQQLRHSQELLRVPAERRAQAETQQLGERQQLENVSERQLRDVKPDTPQELRAYERHKADEERRPIVQGRN
jgi:hypothetical protein